MKRIIVTFGGKAYDATLKRIAEDGPRFGADEVWIYDEPWLKSTGFIDKHRWFWDHPGHKGHKYGFGWYVWKPAVILHAMKHMADGDLLLYLDADTYPIADFSILYREAAEDHMFAFEATGCVDRHWVKRDVWEAVYPSAIGRGLDTQHATARFIVADNSVTSRSFMQDWLMYCTTPPLTTRDPSALPEYERFIENRGDQSIFSLLCHKYGLPLHREADAFGESSDKDRELYGQLFVQEYCAGDRNDLSGSKYRRGPGL